VRETLLALYQLQKIDTRAYELTQRAESIPKLIHELESSLDGLRSELGNLNTEVETLKREQNDIEAKNAEEGDKHKKWKTRLHDLKSPREYQALSREVEMGERQIRDSEERITELMIQVEDRQKVIEDKTLILRDGEQEVSGKVRALREEQARLKAEAEAASSGRDAVGKKINKRVLQRYEDLRAKRNGLAVVLTSDGACSGCNMTVRPQQLVEMQRFNSIEQCAACHRIMVHENLLKQEERAE
jgi:predicted  nucleic acid-binding Zn-ribbon protein